MLGLNGSFADIKDSKDMTAPLDAGPAPQVEVATLGAGCFWCVEAVFQELNGILSLESGYAGGDLPHPTYEDICTGTSGHAEVCQIRFDPSRIGYRDVLEVFWKTHDPTTRDRQGNDVGTQYRSVILTHNDRQMELARHYKKELDASGAWASPIGTEIVPLKTFYKAEDYHQNYYRDNPTAGYCLFIIRPKMDKFWKVFKEKLKKQERALSRVVSAG